MPARNEHGIDVLVATYLTYVAVCLRLFGRGLVLETAVEVVEESRERLPRIREAFDPIAVVGTVLENLVEVLAFVFAHLEDSAVHLLEVSTEFAEDAGRVLIAQDPGRVRAVTLRYLSETPTLVLAHAQHLEP